MKRALVFLLFGPLILGSALSVLQGDPTAIGWAVGVPVAGIVLALPTAAVDYSLKQQRWQLACVTLCGYLLVALLSRSWLAGIAGGISAMVCSWLANQSWRPDH
jgi:hypothetical protein